MKTRTSANPQSTLLRWHAIDTAHGITKETATRAAKQLGFNETQLIHEALAFYLPRVLPQYDVSFDALTAAELAAVDARVPQTETGKPLSSIIG